VKSSRELIKNLWDSADDYFKFDDEQISSQLLRKELHAFDEQLALVLDENLHKITLFQDEPDLMRLLFDEIEQQESSEPRLAEITPYDKETPESENEVYQKPPI
jgi:hypothetical protein